MKKILIVISLLVVISLLTSMIVMARPRVKKVRECRDGIDNDGDGKIDLEDAGCNNRGDNDESNCGDGVCEIDEYCPIDCELPPQNDTPMNTTPLY